jgi:hypothetical protein
MLNSSHPATPKNIISKLQNPNQYRPAARNREDRVSLVVDRFAHSLSNLEPISHPPTLGDIPSEKRQDRTEQAKLTTAHLVVVRYLRVPPPTNRKSPLST